MADLDFSATASEYALQFYQAMRSQPPIRLPLRPEDEAVLARATARMIRFGPQDTLVARVFGNEHAPVVALMHGWGGQGTQFYRMAQAVADAGFQAVVVDFGNHGESAPMKLGFDRFMFDARHLADHLGGMPFAWVAHSAAALGIMSARRTHGISARAFVTIAAPFVPYVPLNRFRSMGASDDAIDQVKPLLAREFQTDWSSLEAGLAWQRDENAQLLAIYDSDDKMVRHTDAGLIAAVWPDCRRFESRGYGHNRVLGAEPVIAATISFLQDAANSRGTSQS